MERVNFRAYLPELKIMLESVDVYASGNIGINTRDLPDKFSKLYYIDWDYDCIRDNEASGNLLSILTGDEYIWIESGFILMKFTGMHDIKNVAAYVGDVYEDSLGKNWLLADDNLSVWAELLPERNENEWVRNITPFIWSKNSKIIGNIHENPKLLNQ